MKVLFWMSTSFQTTSRHLLIDIILKLVEHGNTVCILQKKMPTEEEALPVELQGQNISCIFVPVKASRKQDLINRFITDIKYVAKCAKFVDDSYDAVFIQSSNVAGLQARIINRKAPKTIMTFNVQDMFPQNAHLSGTIKGPAYLLLRKSHDYVYSRSNHIIAISDDIRNYLIELGVESKKIEVVYNWSYQDEPIIRLPLTTSITKMFDPSRFNVVYAGNIGRMQNVEILIKAAAILKYEDQIWFQVIGDGVYKAKVEELSRNLGLKNISFWSMQDSSHAYEIYSNADINIIPLARNIYKTALPSKTASCLACNRPIIFCIGKDSLFGMKTKDNTGCPLVESDDPDELAKMILDIKMGSIKCDTESFFKAHFSRTINSAEYARIITQ